MKNKISKHKSLARNRRGWSLSHWSLGRSLRLNHVSRLFIKTIDLRFRLLIYLLPIFLLSCEEEIDLRLENTEPRLVVDGLITDEFKRHTVRLTLSDNYQLDESHPMVSGASLSIDDGEQMFFLTETAPGVYQTDSLSGTIGKAYTMKIFWQDQQYSATDTLLPVTEPEFPYISIESDRFEYEYRRHLFGLPKPNRWELNILPDVSPPDLDTTRFGQQIGIKVYADGRREFTYFTHPSIEVNGLLNFEEGHFYGFRSGATITLKKYSVSDTYYQFLRGAFQETEWRGTLFDVIPANVATNVSGNALGFFAASAVKEIRMRIE